MWAQGSNLKQSEGDLDMGGFIVSEREWNCPIDVFREGLNRDVCKRM